MPKDYTYWVDKILSSKHFSSGNDARLLRYLVDATLHNRDLKETIIAMDVFDRGYTFHPGDDSVVRSSIYNLRKKLDVYYLDEGKNDPVRLRIPKGNYKVQFEEVEGRKPVQPSEKKKFNHVVYLIITGLLLVMIGTLISLYFRKVNKLSSLQNIDKENYFWGDFIRSQNSLLIVAGDYFMIEKIQPEDSTISYIRETDINNQQEFMEYLNAHPKLRDELKAFGLSYFGEEIPWCLNEILNVFQGYDKNISVKYSSEISFQDVRNNDIIFIGDFSTLGNLNLFLENTHYNFKLTPPGIVYLDADNDTLEQISIHNPPDEMFQNDYALVTKFRSYEDNLMMMFLSFSPFGKSEALYKLTEESFPEELKTIQQPLPAYWDLLIKVSGIESSGFYYDIVHFDAITP